ncbi:HalOD1 output domain-containing protein [Natrinema hispanicum]|uniref:Halobacterial output domain-containing protein n=1 Tax=Natrinema hispanicum TaxID=392421 RepID=A0A1I0IL66_9EURY|nr:HalOD1 output domain-containing protein [Natrinema hispanicum]SET97695.1 hypothetical protein SAMN04488694_12222 [Natrinema hispanicum]
MEDTTAEWQEYTIPSKILQKVSKKEDCNKLDLPPLYHSVDPDALDALSTTCRIQFEYIGYKIIIENGKVTIEE